MNELPILFMMVCGTVIIVAAMYFASKALTGHHKTLELLQKVHDNPVADQVLSQYLKPSRSVRDFRRGVLLLALGVSCALVFLFMGGNAWVLGLIPVALGIVYIGLSKLNANP